MSKILIVDDEKSIREPLRAFLLAAGHEVEVAEDAARAQALLSNGGLDVVVTDIVMPGISGVGLLHAIRAAAPDVQVIMMTGEPTAETAAEAVRAGASDYLVKPVDKSAIIRAVAQAAKVKTLEDNRRRMEELLKERTAALEANNAQLTTEIIERRQAEEELRKLSRAVEQSPATVAITDVKGTIEYVNPQFAKTTGYTREEAVGQNPRILKSGTHPPPFYAELWSTISAGNVWHGEFCNKKKNGEVFFESAAIAPVRNEQGQITHFVAIKEDITERKRAEAELRQAKDSAETANRAKSDFLANMSHELRTPLGAIIGFSELLEEKLFGDLNPKQEEYVNDIVGSGRHLLALINDILDLAKIEAGKMELELSTFHIATLLDDSLVMVKEKCLKNGIRLTMDIPDPVRALSILADERKLKQVMFNLLSNAAKFTPDGGTIMVSARMERRESIGVSEYGSKGVDRSLGDGQSRGRSDTPTLLISVTDTGMGIAREHQGKLFSEFYQVSGGKRGKTPGTGLGLALVKHIVEQHGGRVWMESDGEGRGCTFGFTLPTGEHASAGAKA